MMEALMQRAEVKPRMAKLGAYTAKAKALDPRKFPEEEFELFSVPSHAEGKPEVVVGKTVGASKQMVEDDTVLLCKINPRINRTWVVSSHTGHRKIASSEWMTFPPSSDFLPKYLGYYLQQDELRDHLALSASGVGGSLMRAKPGLVKDYPFPLFPLPEQRRIVSAIETQLGRLDAAVSRLHAAKAKLKRYKQAVLKAAFSEGEPTRLEELCEFITKGTTPTKTMFSEKGTVPFIKVYNLTRDGSLDFTVDPTFVEQSVHEKFLARSIVYPGDLLMNIVGPPLGKVSLVPDDYPEWNINQAIVRYRAKEKLRTKYLMYYLLCDSTAQELMATTKATAGQFNLTLAHCRDLQIPLIPIDEQDFLIEHLEQRLGVIDETETTLDAQLLQSTRLRQAVLKRAFEGRLV